MTSKSSEKPKTIFSRIFSVISPVAFIGLILGAIGGYIYYIEIGCNSGTCPLTSNPYMSILWGAAMGYLLGDIFKRNPKPQPKEEELR
jgi:hypothetical protein